MAHRPGARVLTSVVLRPLRDHYRAEGRAESTRGSFRGSDLGLKYQNPYKTITV